MTCDTCMNDPYCGWNVRNSVCENARLTESNLVSLNSNLCSRFKRQDVPKSIELLSGTNAYLHCNIQEEYLYEFVQWRKDDQLLDFNTANNIFLTVNRGKNSFVINIKFSSLV
jgi:hypothetical protein